jgi:hypothetical protein
MCRGATIHSTIAGRRGSRGEEHQNSPCFGCEQDTFGNKHYSSHKPILELNKKSEYTYIIFDAFSLLVLQAILEEFIVLGFLLVGLCVNRVGAGF